MTSSRFDAVPRLARVLGLAVAVPLAIAVILVAPAWVSALSTPSMKRQANTVFLNGALVAYLLALGLAGLGALVLALGLARNSKGPRPRRLWLAKGLLLCVSCLLSFALMEAGAFAWHSWRHRIPDLASKTSEPPPEEPADPLREAAATKDVNRPADSPSRPLKILVIGESSARGEPYQDWLSVGQILGWKLGEVFPGRKVEVDMQAEPGISLEMAHQKLATIPGHFDVLVLFAGHNEFQGRFSWIRNVVYYDFERERRPEVSPIEFMLKHSPVCRLILETLEAQKIPVAPKKVVTRGVVDGPAFSQSEKDDLVVDFRRRLDSIAGYCERIGTVPVFVCPASNDRDFDPSRSMMLPEATREQIDVFTSEFLRAREMVSTDPAAAKTLLGRLLEEQPVYAEAHYWLAKLLEAEGDWSAARRHYLQARELDGMPIRCPEAFREQYRAVAREHPGVVLVDGDAVLTPMTGHGVLGDHQFHDAHHPTLLGYIALTRDAMDRIAARGLLDWPLDTPSPRIDPVACADHFRLDRVKWATVLKRTESFYERTAFMKFDPTARNLKAEVFGEASRKVAAGLPPEETGLPGVGTLPTEEPAAEREGRSQPGASSESN